MVNITNYFLLINTTKIKISWIQYLCTDAISIWRYQKIKSVPATFTRLVSKKLNSEYDNCDHRHSFLNLDT